MPVYKPSTSDEDPRERFKRLLDEAEKAEKNPRSRLKLIQERAGAKQLIRSPKIPDLPWSLIWKSLQA